MLAAQLIKLPDERKQHYAKDLGPMRIFLWICAANLAMGISYIPAAHFFGASNIENIIEWNFAFLMHINFGVLSLVWRRQNLKLHLELPA